MEYEIDIPLDLGDLGEVPASVGATVKESGLFDPGEGYLEITIEYATAVFPSKNGKDITRVEVAHLLSKAAKAWIGEKIESLYQMDKYDQKTRRVGT